MKWINGLTCKEKEKRSSRWHKWFAWHPVRVGITTSGHRIMVWLETVERQGENFWGMMDWRYRDPNSPATIKWKGLNHEPPL